MTSQESFGDRVRALRSRGGPRSASDRWLLVIGGALLPLGFVFILLGWEGVSRNVVPYRQLPYLVSGGILGLAFVIAGGFTYFSYWQTVQVREGRTRHEESQAVLLRIELLLTSQATPATATLVATTTGTLVHRSDCQAVAGRTGLRPVTLETEGLSPCQLCHP